MVPVMPASPPQEVAAVPGLGLRLWGIIEVAVYGLGSRGLGFRV